MINLLLLLIRCSGDCTDRQSATNRYTDANSVISICKTDTKKTIDSWRLTSENCPTIAIMAQLVTDIIIPYGSRREARLATLAVYSCGFACLSRPLICTLVQKLL